MQDGRQPAETANEVHQPGGLAVDHHVRTQCLEVVGGQFDALLQRDFEHGLETNAAVEVTVQVDQRQARVDVKIVGHE
jgi:hypothetical protein